VPEIKVEFGPCCFCGSSILASETDPCTVTVTTAQNKWQVWKCHGQCFRTHLIELPKYPGLFEPAHF
jgi:hypothetical protein